MGNAGAVLVFMIIRAIFRVANESSAARNAAPRAAPPPPLYGYDVPCPICGVAHMQEARVLHVIRGRGWFTALDSRVVAGCSKCVRRASRRAIARDAFRGLGSVGGLFAAPYYAVRDLRDLSRPPRRETVESLIHQAGLNPDKVRLDVDGLVPRERARLNIDVFVCATLVWAMSQCAPKAHEIAVAYLRDAFKGKLSDKRVREILYVMRVVADPVCLLSPDQRAPYARLIRNLALADGPLTEQMSAAIHHVASTLGFSGYDITELFREIGYAARGTSGAEEAQREARAKHSSANGNQQQHQEDPRARRHRRMREDLEKARILLGVSSTASYSEIERAYRTIIAACHPDRAGLDPRLQKLFTEKAQQITWAKEALRRSFQAQAS
jgi:hypothetical protein